MSENATLEKENEIIKDKIEMHDHIPGDAYPVTVSFRKEAMEFLEGLADDMGWDVEDSVRMLLAYHIEKANTDPAADGHFQYIFSRPPVS